MGRESCARTTTTMTKGALRNALTLLLLVTFCIGSVVAEEDQGEPDFDFADTDAVVKVVKRAATLTDDEDFFADEPGSTPDDSYEGSGTLEPPITTSKPVVPDYPVYFRVTLNFTDLVYTSGLANRNSREFRDLAQRLQQEIEQLFRNIPGQQLVTILQFNQGSLQVTFDLGSQGFTDEATLRGVIEEAIRRGVIGRHSVTMEGFSFRPLDADVQCPNLVGRAPDRLPRTGNNRAHFLINNAFPCDGSVVGWEYYRLVPVGTAYVGVWRQRSDTEFILVRKTELPATSVGVHTISLPYPIPVQRGDFIGIFYPRRTAENVVASATLADNVVRMNELYQDFHAEVYDDMLEEGRAFDISTVNFDQMNSTFALRALLDYQGQGRPDIFYTCRPDEYSCGDGYCIDANYRCDNQIDCPSGVDEENCEDETCGEDEFRCRSGECIALFLQCNGERDCRDSSDEEDCPVVPDRCASNEFRCLDGSCISAALRCDSRADCPEGDDEFRCPCDAEREFTCNDGTCIPLEQMCDAFPDCPDTSDEDPVICLPTIPTVPPACPEGLFRCASGVCINERRRCNGVRDCEDGSDELECEEIECGPGEFRCGDGTCIDARLQCDGVSDCTDLTDEANCVRTCTSFEFTCNNGQCVDTRSRCNNILDCQDGSDESGCPCLADEFTCRDGQCIPLDRQCDGQRDCRDDSDEENCPRCRRNEFECIDGTCIDRRRKCDRSLDCPDGTDEFNCTCNRAEFRCDNGQCVLQTAVCDRRRDCLDGSDESDCVQECRQDQFTCENGECIDRRRRCDGRPDCTDRSDESDCPTRRRCPEDMFECGTGHCLDQNRVCDGRRDCPDGSDEQECPGCRDDQFTCASGQCIPVTARCDGLTDCEDFSDERDCPCREEEFTCVSDGRCLPPGYRCNGNADCRDGSDERDCPERCSANEFNCTDGTCIPSNRVCDGRRDCPNGADEVNCVSSYTITVTPQQLRVRSGRNALFVCIVSGRPPPDQIRWVRRTGGAMPSRATDANGRLTIQQVRPEDAGDYQCQAFTVSGRIDADARLGVDYIGPTEEPRPDGPCQRDEATCQNGQCIPRDYLCDGDQDCTDGSDERNCTYPLPCEPNEFRCSNGRCAMKIWRCDGDNDCGDGSDEANCPTRQPGAPCRADEFQCQTGDQCIPFSYQCDGEIDCQDRSDEIQCMEPSIKVSPEPEIQVAINGTFTIICEAMGVPTPLIVWRLNWGNIPTGPRVTVTSVNGRGTLTVRNVVPEDAGAYTCEALNNRGSIFAIPDAMIIVTRTVGPCDDRSFNDLAETSRDCVRCFCFGRTTRCTSSDLRISQITLGNRIELVRRTTLEPTDDGIVQYIPASREFQVIDFNRVLRQGSYYWSLPYQYLSKRISSYGGELSYQVYYEVDSFDVPTDDPDVIITGNGITIYHRRQEPFRPRQSNTVRVPLIETAWERSRPRFGDTSISEYASREDMLLVLENVTSILIRASYDNRQSLIRIGNVLLTTGVRQITGLGRANLVELCSCPVGYAGLSCEDCAPGFYRVERGRYGRECIACNCNGHSNECDPLTGLCLNCRDNTIGPYCNQCASGFAGDPRQGTASDCRPCPCPLTTPQNQFSPTCIIEADGEFTCTQCPEGYLGRRCERCAEGYRGDPTIPGDRCIRRDDVGVCDPRGSISRVPNILTGQCECKANAYGPLCNQCNPGSFYLSSDFPYGCISCFCMGVTQTCQSTTWRRSQVRISFRQSPMGVVITDMMRKQPVSTGLSVNRQTNEVVYRGFNNMRDDVYYWSLPQQFLGNKVTSYGGNLRFTLRYRPGFDSTPISLSDPVVEIGGNDITLVYRMDRQFQPNRQESFQIPLIETFWVRMDGEPATREHLLMALADLEFILIRATYTEETEESALGDVSLDIAEDRDTNQERAYPVEECVCPRGYKGLSCEDCDTGYTRSGGGLYLGLCVPCDCNGHSSECDPETGVCRNCRYNTEGDKCERCARGYYGDATRGSVNDCQKCPCPLTESPNQFSPDCILDVDGQVTCTACPIGYTGRRCESCEPGYQGNPLQPGDYCKQMNVSCDCDRRGTQPNTLCDPNTQQCRCKANVQGRRCNQCQEGHFYLNEDNERGCLRCYCMGITTQCTSSNYYRSEIRPVFNSDGTHNFMLTNRRFSRTITDGFTINFPRNDITFNNFEGIKAVRESLFFNLPAKFRGNKVTSYGGYLEFGLSYERPFDADRNRAIIDVDVEIIGNDNQRVYYLFSPQPEPGQFYDYRIHLVESSFRNQVDVYSPSREAFMAILADIKAILIRATYHEDTTSVTLRGDISMEIAVPQSTGMRPAPEVESCTCPEGYTGLSCQECAAGYLRMEDSATALGRCVRCTCNGHATSCDPDTGVCMNCQHNTEGDRCERCKPGYYGNPTAGTPSDCRVCPCPLTIPSNQFSRTCFLDTDNRVTCDRCPQGYTGRDCGTCAPGYSGNPRQPGSRCVIIDDETPEVTVNPVTLTEPLGSIAVFRCNVRGRGPFNVVWSRLDGLPLPSGRFISRPGPNYELSISNLEFGDTARYVCTATNAYGSSREFVQLTVERIDTPIRVRIEEPTTLISRPGATARFICVAVAYSSEANYVLTWTKDGGNVPDKAIDQNGVLVIPNLDERDLGTYTCTGSDPGSTDRATAIIRFGDVPEAPQVRIEPRYLQVTAGDFVEFQCRATGSPTPTVLWTKGRDGPLPSYVVTDERGLFRIQSVSLNDQSEYYCTATNEHGTNSVRTIIYVTGDRRPEVRIIVRRANIIAVVGTTVQLECYAEDNRDVILVWSREGGLPLGSRQENGILTLENVQRSYGGNYVCTGTSATGETGSGTARVTISGTREEPPSVTVDPDSQTVGMGITGSIRCIVTGSPRPTVSWTRARGELSSNHQVVGDTLRIVQATMDDRGIYICSAENTAGRAAASAVVEIERRESPEVEVYPAQQQTINIGGSAMFQCRVTSGTPAPTVTWTRVGNRPFTANTEVKSNGYGAIMFTDVTGEEQGEYICTATNAVGTITLTASLRIAGPPSITITPGNRVTAIVGDRVNIECVAISDPPPTVFWRSESRRRSDVLPEAYQPGPGQAGLEFDPVGKSDEGRYICVATNERGRTEETVDLTVLESDEQRGPVVEIAGPERLSVVTGQSVELTCTARGLRNPLIRWRRAGGQPLPPDHSVRNGVLYIPRVDAEYAGEYICTVTDDAATEFIASIFIIVTVTPRLTISPARVTARPGQGITLRCQPSGSGPFNIEWQKVNGVISPQARELNGILEIRQVTAADAGRYKCIATNDAGTSEGFADVEIFAPPVVTVTPKQESSAAGSTVEFRCGITGETASTQVVWEKEGGALPLQHQIRNGILTIYNAGPDDSGRYICTVTNEAGSARDFAVLRVAGSSGIGSTINEAVKDVDVGDRVEFECIVTGKPRPTMTWSKVEGPLPASAIIGEGLLIIPSARPEDAGIYKCTATNMVGSVQSQVQLFVQSRPIISVPQDYTTAALGSPAQLKCEAEGQPRPRIQWVKENGDLPAEHSIVEGSDLYIPRVREEDGGKYNCLATNRFGTSRYPVVLIVGALVPYFTQDGGSSYMTFQPLSDVYLDLDIQLSFRPEATDGMLLYNGQYDTGSGDFMCFGLRGQYPEFRFDVGAGPAIIRGRQPLELNRWHTVQLTRKRKNGTLLVNDQPPVYGEAPGQFQGLDLALPMYVGSVPDYRAIPRSVGFSTGFVGGLSEIKVKGVDLNLGAEAVEIVNVQPYNVCQDRPCRNNGRCVPANNRYGFECECPQGYAGSTCELIGERCYQGACGPQGRCYNLPEATGFQCICPIGYTGQGCRRALTIVDPAFNKTSFISYSTIENGLLSVSFHLILKPRSLDDGIILYNAQRQDGKQDFIAILIKNSFLQFRFDTGSGPAVLQSRQPLRTNEWSIVMAERKGRSGMLVVNNEDPVNEQVEASDDLFTGRDRGDVLRGTAEGRTIGLNLERPLYLGGVDPSETISQNVGTYDGFVGCIGELKVNDENIGLIEDAIESTNVQDCGDRSLCERQPCQNGASCVDVSPSEYRCICTPGYTGKDCEVEINICVTAQPCRNGGLCQADPLGGYRCKCPLGYIGRNCEIEVTLGSSVELLGDGYAEFDRGLLPHRRRQTGEEVEMTITTTESTGLFFWQAHKAEEQERRDYLALALEDGYVVFRYELGSGAAELRSALTVDDGLPHRIIAHRLGREGNLTIDSQPPVLGTSQGPLQVLNVQGNLFFGGVPELQVYTAGLFTRNFAGCLSDVRIQENPPLDFGTDALSGMNLRPCLN